MNDNLFDPSIEPTKPLYPPSTQQPNQGKFVVGNFDAQPQRPHHPPYQNPMDPTRKVAYNPQPQPQMPPMAAQQQVPYNPNAQPYPYSQPAGFEGYSANSKVKPKGKSRPKRRRGCLVGCLVVLLLLCVVGGFLAFTAQRVLAFGTAISTQSPLSTQTNYMGTNDRVNILVMGYGGGKHDGSNLTDSMMIMSPLPQSRHTTLISVPRDLWVQVPANSGN